jgi:hypothetical protein
MLNVLTEGSINPFTQTIDAGQEDALMNHQHYTRTVIKRQHDSTVTNRHVILGQNRSNPPKAVMVRKRCMHKFSRRLLIIIM